MITVKVLKNLIQDLPDNTEIYVCSQQTNVVFVDENGLWLDECCYPYDHNKVLYCDS